MNVLLLNVLIASMTNSFSKMTQDEGLRLLHSKAEIIDELEATLPKWVRSVTWYPTFVHILKIHPDATYEVRHFTGLLQMCVYSWGMCVSGGLAASLLES